MRTLLSASILSHEFKALKMACASMKRYSIMDLSDHRWSRSQASSKGLSAGGADHLGMEHGRALATRLRDMSCCATCWEMTENVLYSWFWILGLGSWGMRSVIDGRMHELQCPAIILKHGRTVVEPSIGANSDGNTECTRHGAGWCGKSRTEPHGLFHPELFILKARLFT